MRIAILSDIHSNLAALEAVLRELGELDGLWVLGDIVGYGPDPDEVVGRLRDLGAIAVRGNHDAAALGQLDTAAFNDDARVAVEWTGRHLAPETQAWLEALPERREESDFTLVHGSPRDPLWEYLLSVRAARLSLRAFATRHCLVGHTHIPLVFHEDHGDIGVLAPEDGTTLRLDERRAILNPGGVGQPRDGDPRACAMVLDRDAGTVGWRRVDYPVEVTQRRMRAAGLPRRLVERLARGL